MEGEGDYERVPPAVEQSVACEKTALEMEDLPNEVLKSILGELVVVDMERPYRWSQESWKSNFRSVIAYRQVSSSWRDFLDEILEKRLLSTIRAWCPPCNIWITTPLSKVQIFYPSTIGLEKDVPCPPSVIGYNGSNPFPGKGVEVVLKDDAVLRTQTTIRLMDLFTKVGHHLSILYLNALITIVDLDVLVSILERCPNLKALVIRDLDVSKDKSPRPLPPLPQLKTLVIDSVTTGPSMKSRFSQWLVEPYACQLVQIANDFPGPVTAPLPKLKQLTLSCPNLSVLQQSGPAVSLLRLCVNIEDSYGWNGSICDVFCYVDKFSTTLVDLYLSVYWSDLIPEANDKVEGNDQEVQQQRRVPLMVELRRVNGKLSTSKVKFPYLKTLAFPYPGMEMHRMLLCQTVLPKFPALEELLFIYSRQSLDESLDYDQSRESIAEFLERENYWTICPKLKKITVIEDGDTEDDGLAFTCSRPMFT